MDVDDIKNNILPTNAAGAVVTTTERADGRAADQLRPVKITRGFTSSAAGSALIQVGNTKVLCTASVAQGVPQWKVDSGQGWVTAEYAMLPGATAERNKRESVSGKIGGRTHEISRLIGRSLRSCIDFVALGENTIMIDCDVLEADGGTRTAAITGAYVALVDAVNYLQAQSLLFRPRAIISQVAAVSVGIIDGQVRLDLPYEEDSRADVDFNVVATNSGELVEVQGTGEKTTYTTTQLIQLVNTALEGIAQLNHIQNEALKV